MMLIGPHNFQHLPLGWSVYTADEPQDFSSTPSIIPAVVMPSTMLIIDSLVVFAGGSASGLVDNQLVGDITAWTVAARADGDELGWVDEDALDWEDDVELDWLDWEDDVELDWLDWPVDDELAQIVDEVDWAIDEDELDWLDVKLNQPVDDKLDWDVDVEFDWLDWPVDDELAQIVDEVDWAIDEDELDWLDVKLNQPVDDKLDWDVDVEFDWLNKLDWPVDTERDWHGEPDWLNKADRLDISKLEDKLDWIVLNEITRLVDNEELDWLLIEFDWRVDEFDWSIFTDDISGLIKELDWLSNELDWLVVEFDRWVDGFDWSIFIDDIGGLVNDLDWLSDELDWLVVEFGRWVDGLDWSIFTDDINGLIKELDWFSNELDWLVVEFDRPVDGFNWSIFIDDIGGLVNDLDWLSDELDWRVDGLDWSIFTDDINGLINELDWLSDELDSAVDERLDDWLIIVGVDSLNVLLSLKWEENGAKWLDCPDGFVSAIVDRPFTNTLAVICAVDIALEEVTDSPISVAISADWFLVDDIDSCAELRLYGLTECVASIPLSGETCSKDENFTFAASVPVRSGSFVTSSLISRRPPSRTPLCQRFLPTLLASESIVMNEMRRTVARSAENFISITICIDHLLSDFSGGVFSVKLFEQFTAHRPPQTPH